MKVCKEELEDQRKVTSRPSKLKDIQLLEWDHKEELIKRSMKGCFLWSGVSVGWQDQQMGRGIRHGVTASEDKLESAGPMDLHFTHFIMVMFKV